jgi:hypothetical protein
MIKNTAFNYPKISPKLYKADDTDRMKYEISPSGYGIHWPSLDEDLSIDGLIGNKHSLPKEPKGEVIK